MHSVTHPNDNAALLRPQIRSLTLSTLTALFLLFATNHTFWAKAAANYAHQPFAFASLVIGLSGAYLAACVTPSVKYLTKPVFILLVIAAASASWFMDSYGVIIDVNMIRNAAETNTAEAGHLITAGFVLHMALYGLLPAAMIAWVRIEHDNFPRKFIRNMAVIVGGLGLFVLAGISFAGTHASLTREHRDMFATLNPFVPIGKVVDYVIASNTERNLVAAPLGTDARLLGLPVAERKPRLTIIVTGETARAENFSLGGYGRPTNPELQARDIFYFKNATSCGTATATSVPCMFSNLTRADYSHSKALATENLLDVLSHAGVHVEWWDNNTGSKNVANRVKEVTLSNHTDKRFCADGECQDGVLLDGLDTWLDGVSQDTVLVLHQMGSHGPAYYLRYPEAFRQFTPECQTAEFSECSREQIVNSYDNTILFTDHVIATIIDKLKAREDKFSPSLFYASDHGESLGEYGLYLHGAPYMLAPSQQTHVPMLVWFGSEQKAEMNLDCLRKETEGPASHDNLFHTALGMMQVDTAARDPALDLASACRKPVATQ